VFGRRGSDLTLDVPLSFAEAALGAKVEVPTLDEPVTLKIPSGTQSGKTFRVRGRGLPKRNGSRGDLLATVNVKVPHKLSKEERELIEKFGELDGAAARDRAKARA
jgi:molecular chaperone DnaJ